MCLTFSPLSLVVGVLSDHVLHNKVRLVLGGLSLPPSNNLILTAICLGRAEEAKECLNLSKYMNPPCICLGTYASMYNLS